MDFERFTEEELSATLEVLESEIEHLREVSEAISAERSRKINQRLYRDN
jgi:hypothetical protein